MLMDFLKLGSDQQKIHDMFSRGKCPASSRATHVLVSYGGASENHENGREFLYSTKIQ